MTALLQITAEKGENLFYTPTPPPHTGGTPILPLSFPPTGAIPGLRQVFATTKPFSVVTGVSPTPASAPQPLPPERAAVTTL